MLPVLGLDVGGANLKAAHTAGPAVTRPFPLWKRPGDLADELRALVAPLPPFARLAVTMTGELCDCFATKREGVRHILDAVEAAAGPVPVQVWTTAGRFVTAAEARADPLAAAAANWLALATFAGRYAPHGPAVLIDVGSTTTDVIPLMDGRPVPAARTDPERLLSGELVYTGVRRTPVCALLGHLGAAELFATTHDVYLVLGMTPADPADRDTADGRPATLECARARLARMVCGDAEGVSPADTMALAHRLYERQWFLIRRQLACALDRLPKPPTPVVVASGSGEWLARAAVAPPSIDPP